MCSGEHRGRAAGLSGAVSSLSGHRDDRSDSGARQQQTQELEATRPAVPPPPWERVEKPAWQAHPPLSSPAPHNSDKVIMRQDVSTACPGTQGIKPPGPLALFTWITVRGKVQPHRSERWKKKTMDQRGLTDTWRTPDSCTGEAFILNTCGCNYLHIFHGETEENTEETSGKLQAIRFFLRKQ